MSSPDPTGARSRVRDKTLTCQRAGLSTVEVRTADLLSLLALSGRGHDMLIDTLVHEIGDIITELRRNITPGDTFGNDGYVKAINILESRRDEWKSRS